MQAQTTQNDLQETKRRFGLKAGLNFFSIHGIKSYNQTLNNNTGFHLGGFFASRSKIMGYRSELVFSRQGYDYKTSSQTGTVMLDYIVMPQLMTVNITRFLQLQAGGQMAFRLKSNVDSTDSPDSRPNPQLGMNYFKNFNYGFAGGIEIRPVAGLLIGGRYNLFMDMLKEGQPAGYPSYIPANSSKLKSGLMQVYLGYQF